MKRSGSKEKVILVGNPGVGKSTILNTVLGSAKFQSGISVATGLTKVLQEHEADDCIYADTPGLEDVRTRDSAAKEISAALRRGGNIKLIFVVTAEAGRLRPSDITTMKHILDAITEVGTDVQEKFSVVINKMSQRVLSAVLKEVDLKTFVNQVCEKYPAGFVDYLAEDDTAKDKEDAILSDPERPKAIIRSSPYIVIKKRAKIKVNTKRYEDMLEEMERKMQKLRDDAEERGKDIKRMEERREEDVQALRKSVEKQTHKAQADYEREMKAMREEAEKQKKEMKEQHERKMKELQMSIESHKDETQAAHAKLSKGGGSGYNDSNQMPAYPAPVPAVYVAQPPPPVVLQVPHPAKPAEPEFIAYPQNLGWKSVVVVCPQCKFRGPTKVSMDPCTATNWFCCLCFGMFCFFCCPCTAKNTHTCGKCNGYLGAS